MGRFCCCPTVAVAVGGGAATAAAEENRILTLFFKTARITKSTLLKFDAITGLV